MSKCYKNSVPKFANDKQLKIVELIKKRCTRSPECVTHQNRVKENHIQRIEYCEIFSLSNQVWICNIEKKQDSVQYEMQQVSNQKLSLKMISRENNELDSGKRFKCIVGILVNGLQHKNMKLFAEECIWSKKIGRRVPQRKSVTK